MTQLLANATYQFSPGPLTKLLMPETITVRNIRYIAVGSHLQLQNGRIRRVTAIRRARPDDWFADDEWVLTLRKPYAPEAFDRVKIEWLEDVLMPRIAGA